MAKWTGVITNAGNSLLNAWVGEKTLRFDCAKAGTGTVEIAALMAQTDLVSQKQDAAILNAESVDGGIRMKLRVTASQEGYLLNQFGVWASVDGKTALIAIYQHEQGVSVPGIDESPDFAFTFYALIMTSNTGTWTVNIDTSALVTLDDMNSSIAESAKKYLPLSGGKMAGNIDMQGKAISGLNEPTEGTQAVPKSYVDKRVPLDGSVPMTGNLSMGAHRITGLAEPEDDGDAATKGYADTKASLPKTASGTVIALSDASDGPLQGLRIYGKTTQDGTPTPEAPVELVSVGESVSVTMVGKNLFNSSALNSSGGVSVTISEDGRTITVIGRGQYTGAHTKIPIEAVRGKTVILAADSAMQTSNIVPYYFIQMTIATESGVTHYKTITPSSLYNSFDMPEDIRSVSLGVYVNNSNTSLDSDNTVVVTGLRVYLSSNAAWEPYITTQTLTISTPNGLPGIPVTSGGNYTDADGQQWICDEVDFARGVYVQRIGTIDSYAGEAVSEPYLSTTGALSTGAKVLYVLAIPIETPIPDDELAAYAAMHTNKPNTTIYNDAGANMEVGYYPPDATMRQEDIMGALDHVGNAAKAYVDGKHFITNVSLPAASWTGDAAPYTQTVPVSGILATDFPHVTPVYSSTLATALAQKEAWSMVNMGVPGAGEITFTCFDDKPATAIPIQIEVMR